MLCYCVTEWATPQVLTSFETNFGALSDIFESFVDKSPYNLRLPFRENLAFLEVDNTGTIKNCESVYVGTKNGNIHSANTFGATISPFSIAFYLFIVKNQDCIQTLVLVFAALFMVLIRQDKSPNVLNCKIAPTETSLEQKKGNRIM